jgi:hypothetical protein
LLLWGLTMELLDRVFFFLSRHVKTRLLERWRTTDFPNWETWFNHRGFELTRFQVAGASNCLVHCWLSAFSRNFSFWS